ncbi:CYFA0S06e00298g1_1 [Cyberlindnera fabianii]|uniref:CYFA0S06e00298g1_1 n=1 Tax=Cyberlindnera fabianii TaxID=36022 RepID=A0A061AV35_CYBFA|nr:CYFA0S06e00298g1_1 [Cyberlindnera fabianii]
MPPPEVIEVCSGSEGEDDIQILEARPITDSRRQRSPTRDTRHSRRLVRSSDDVEIVEERQVEPALHEEIYLPDGPHALPNTRRPNRENASFDRRRSTRRRQQMRDRRERERQELEREAQELLLDEEIHRGHQPFWVGIRQPLWRSSFDGAQQALNRVWVGRQPNRHQAERQGLTFEMLNDHFNHLLYGQQNADAGDAIPPDVMAAIQASEERVINKKIEVNYEATKKVQSDIQDRINNIKEPYTCAISEDEEYACVLCGVTLGGGIPSDFAPPKLTKPLAALQEKNDVQAPYEAMKLVTDVDRDLSKRIFSARCGHTYCGRCVKNISNVKGSMKEVRKKGIKRTDNVIDNPFVYAPLKCVGGDCQQRLGGRTAFFELFL